MNRIDKWLDIGYKNSKIKSLNHTVTNILSGLLQDDIVPNASFIEDMLDLSFTGCIIKTDKYLISVDYILSNWLVDEDIRHLVWHYCEHYIYLRLNVKDEWR